MKQDEINAKVLARLQEYAQVYFEALVKANSIGGKCSINPGKYSAKELEDKMYKCTCAVPCDALFDEEIAIEAGTFRCTLPYHQIFTMLAKWETMMRAGKQKAVFEIGDVEEKSAKVLLNETTELGSYKEKRVKVQRITGNWWAPRKSKKHDKIYLYYELNGVMFIPGKYVWDDDELHSDSTKEWCKRFDDAKLTGLLLAQVSTEGRESGYWSEVATRAGLATPQTEAEAQQPATATETPQISTEEPEMANVSAEEEKRGIMHISEIIETCRLHDETGEETDEWKYYQWLASVNHNNYQTIADKALTEALTNIFLAAYRRGKGHVLAMNDHGELVDTVFVVPHPEPTDNPGSVTQTARNTPQPPETPPTANYATPTPKLRRQPRERPITAAWRHRHRIRQKLAGTASCLGIILPPPGICSTANSPPATGKSSLSILVAHDELALYCEHSTSLIKEIFSVIKN